MLLIIEWHSIYFLTKKDVMVIYLLSIIKFHTPVQQLRLSGPKDKKVSLIFYLTVA